MSEIEKILERMYEKLGISKDSEFCKKFNIKQSTVSSWKNRNSIPYEIIVKISQNANFSLDYVLKGKEKNNINYKEEIIKSLEKLSENDIKSIYHFTKSKEN
ncbi:helix-turn-helix domain-containing protein [Campylobacterota bacterium DY0563]